MFAQITPEHFFIWFAVGGGIGWLFDAVVKRRPGRGAMDIAVGVFGGVVGALIIGDIGLPFDLWSVRLEQAVAAAIGAVVALLAVSIFERFF